MERNIILIDDLNVTFDLDALGKKLGARSSARMATLLQTLADEARPIAKPKAAAKLCSLSLLPDDQVQLDDTVFKSALLKQQVEGLGKAFPYVATEGEELAEWARSYTGLERALANGLQYAAMSQARERLEAVILEKYGLEQVSAMNPGSLAVWPITQQTPLFDLLKPLPEKLGMTLLPSYMMKPEHSVSGIFFQTDSKFHNCQLCPQEACPSRRVPYTGMV